MRLAVVDMEEERAVRREDAVRLHQPGLDERHEVVERIRERLRAELQRAVALALEAGAIAALVVAHGSQSIALLHLAGVERRVDVDEVGRARLDSREHRHIVGKHDAVHLVRKPTTRAPVERLGRPRPPTELTA